MVQPALEKGMSLIVTFGAQRGLRAGLRGSSVPANNTVQRGMEGVCVPYVLPSVEWQQQQLHLWSNVK